MSDTKVTTRNIIAVSPSTWSPMSIGCSPPKSNHSQCRWTTSSSLIHWAPTSRASTKLRPTASRPNSAPFIGMRFPKNRMTKYDTAGMKGMSQEFSAMEFALSPSSGRSRQG
jgi:hypothetical protein